MTPPSLSHFKRVLTGFGAVVFVLLAASFSGTASDEPELTPEAIAEQQAAEAGVAAVEVGPPQEPLAELGVAPGTGPAETPAETAGQAPAGADSPAN